MLQKFLKNKTGQSIIEYGLILTLVLAGVMVMGPHVIRSWNALVKGYDDDIQDSHNDPITTSPPGGTVIPCSCSYQPPCNTPAPCCSTGTCSPGVDCSVPLCCNMGGCPFGEDSLVEYCNPLGCGSNPPICTPHAECCFPPVPGNPPDDCGAGGCPPTQLLATQLCGDGSTRNVCLDSFQCVFQCVDTSGTPIDFNVFEADTTRYKGRCPFDDQNLTADTTYLTIFGGDCSAPDGSNPKCELECARGMVPSFGNTTCDCPAGAFIDLTGPIADVESGNGCAACPYGTDLRCDTTNPSNCDTWCLPNPRWRNIYTWNTTAGGGWQCPGGATATPGCIDENPTTLNSRPYCSGGYLVPGGNHNWVMHAAEGGYCEYPPCQRYLYFDWESAEHRWMHRTLRMNDNFIWGNVLYADIINLTMTTLSSATPIGVEDGSGLGAVTEYWYHWSHPGSGVQHVAYDGVNPVTHINQYINSQTSLNSCRRQDIYPIHLLYGIPITNHSDGMIGLSHIDSNQELSSIELFSCSADSDSGDEGDAGFTSYDVRFDITYASPPGGCPELCGWTNVQSRGEWTGHYVYEERTCPQICADMGMRSVPSPSGPVCASGEVVPNDDTGIFYPWGKIGSPLPVGQTSYSWPQGTWTDCYIPGQPRNRQTTDRLAACYCCDPPNCANRGGTCATSPGGYSPPTCPFGTINIGPSSDCSLGCCTPFTCNDLGGSCALPNGTCPSGTNNHGPTLDCPVACCTA